MIFFATIVEPIGGTCVNLFDYFHNHPPAISYYMDRKLKLPDDHNHINIYGVRGAGKSALVLDYLEDMDHETLLYIDCEDPNLLFLTLSLDEMQEYIYSASIELLVLDHYDSNIIKNLPQVERIIIISRVAAEIEGFVAVELFPLDYEEFLSFERGISPTNSFNHFLKQGTLPMMSKSTHTSSIDIKLFLQSRFDPQEIKLFALLAIYQTNHLTIHQIYGFAKERFAVSKDWLYKKIKEFQDEGVLYFIEDSYQKGGKKLILFDFVLSKYCTVNQPFITKFDTMIALALIKHKRVIKTLGIHGYLTQNGELVIPAPFESEESMWKKSHTKFSLYKKYEITSVTIVTVANCYSYNIENIVFEALPFYEWSIVNEE